MVPTGNPPIVADDGGGSGLLVLLRDAEDNPPSLSLLVEGWLMYRAFFDLETTGLDITIDEPVELAAVVVNGNGGFEGDFHHLIRTTCPISPSASAVHGITLEKLSYEGVIPADVVREWKQFFYRFYPVTLIGYNCLTFDYPMLCNFINRHSSDRFKFPTITGVWDAMHLVSMKLKTRKWLKLTEAAVAFGVSIEGLQAHSAMGDVKLLAGLWEAMRKQNEGQVK